jgi:hypothetical protein
MSSVVISGDTSGSVSLTVPATAGSNTITLPALTGTAVIAGQNSAITAGTSVASTSGTSIDFTGIPSWVKRITVMFSGVSTSGTSNYQLQVGSTTFQTTGYSSRALRDGNTALTATTGFLLTASIAAGSLNGGLITLTNISGNLWVFTSILADATGGNNNYSGGYMTSALSGILDRVRITTVNGTDTFDAGSINILYE